MTGEPEDMNPTIHYIADESVVTHDSARNISITDPRVRYDNLRADVVKFYNDYNLYNGDEVVGVHSVLRRLAGILYVHPRRRP